MHHKNKYKLNNHPFVPYVYFIRHTPTGIWYIGAKCSKNANPNTFLKDYFTSSKLIHELMETSSIADFETKIIRTFDNANDTTSHEKRILVKLKAVENPMSANLDDKQESSKAIQNRVPVRRISNPQTKKCLTVNRDMPLPDGWIEGNINSKGLVTSKGRRWFYDPETLIPYHLPKNEVPEPNLVAGRGPNYVSNSETMLSKNLMWITDGVTSNHIVRGSPIPDGFYAGMSKTETSRKNNTEANTARTGMRYYTNGSITRQYKLEDVPDGWYAGNSTIHPNKNKIKITNEIADTYINKGDTIPDGYRLGGKPKPRKSINIKHKYTDGNTTIFINTTDIVPDGFILMSEYRELTKPHLFPKAPVICITNGIEEKTLRFNLEIPEGWKRGKLHTQPRTKFVELTDPDTGEKIQVYHSDTYLYPHHIRNTQRYKKGDVAPNKGRKMYRNANGKVRYFKSTDTIPDGYFTT